MSGVHPVLEALRSDRQLNRLWVARSGHRHEVEEILRLARAKRVPLYHAERDQLNRLAGGIMHQGVVAQVAPRSYFSLEDLLQEPTPDREPLFLLALDQIEDPHNLGAIIRSAEVTGAHGVIIPSRRASPVTTVVARASAGALEHIRLSRVVNMARVLELCRQAGLLVVGLAGEVDTSLFSLSLTGPLVLVVGGEERGLRRLVREKCDVLAALPMRGRIGSLNASAASAVALYEVLRQRMVRQ